MVKPSRRHVCGAPPRQRPWVTSRAPGGHKNWHKVYENIWHILKSHDIICSGVWHILKYYKYEITKMFRSSLKSEDFEHTLWISMNHYTLNYVLLCFRHYDMSFWKTTHIEVDITTSICGNLESSGRLALRSMTPHTGLVSIVLCNAVQLWTNRSGGKRNPETRSGLKKWDGSVHCSRTPNLS